MRGLLSQLQPHVNQSTMQVDVAFTGFTTDSRKVQPGDLFLALRGERFDAHDF